jgi:glycogen operon protein
VPNPPVIWDIETDPVLAGTKLIAEAWDAAGLYQVGSFVGDAWQEWNGKFRDDVRRFLKGDDGMVSALATRILGSPDLFAREDREPEQSINFVTCHDGFTLDDLVSYDRKHNEGNGEENRDGSNDNHSWNCGVEGPTEDPGIEALRNRQVKNFLAVEMLAVGTPMLLMGDEVRRTQAGNNNAYCQDDELVWFDWRLLERHADIHRFVQILNTLRSRRDVVAEVIPLTLSELLAQARIEWHGVALSQPDWGERSHALACTIHTVRGSFLLHTMFNAYWEPLDFEIPHARAWRRCIDTSLDSPEDIWPYESAPAVGAGTYRVGPRSVVLLMAKPD